MTLNINELKTLQEASLKETMSERFLKIFPSIPMMLATLVALVLVILILTFLTYKPLRKAIAARRKFIQDNIDNTKKNHELSLAKLDEANTHLTRAHNDAHDIIKDAKLKAEKVMLSYTAKAKSQAKQMLAEAELDINQQREQLMQETKKHVVEAAVELSKKIIQKDVSKKAETEIIDKFLKNKSE